MVSLKEKSDIIYILDVEIVEIFYFFLISDGAQNIYSR